MLIKQEIHIHFTKWDTGDSLYCMLHINVLCGTHPDRRWRVWKRATETETRTISWDLQTTVQMGITMSHSDTEELHVQHVIFVKKKTKNNILLVCRTSAVQEATFDRLWENGLFKWAPKEIQIKMMLVCITFPAMMNWSIVWDHRSCCHC